LKGCLKFESHGLCVIKRERVFYILPLRFHSCETLYWNFALEIAGSGVRSLPWHRP
jgi:hypothetical protein